MDHPFQPSVIKEIQKSYNVITVEIPNSEHNTKIDLTFFVYEPISMILFCCKAEELFFRFPMFLSLSEVFLMPGQVSFQRCTISQNFAYLEFEFRKIGKLTEASHTSDYFSSVLPYRNFTFQAKIRAANFRTLSGQVSFRRCKMLQNWSQKTAQISNMVRCSVQIRFFVVVPDIGE